MSGSDEWVDILLDKSRINHYKGTDIGQRVEELGTISLRMVKVPLPEEREEILLTNLPSETFDCGQIAELYHMRWDKMPISAFYPICRHFINADIFVIK